LLLLLQLLLPVWLPLLLLLRGLVLLQIPPGPPRGKGQVVHRLPLLLLSPARPFFGGLASPSAPVAGHFGKKKLTRDIAPRKAPGELVRGN
jgi:hypothetical protein